MKFNVRWITMTRQYPVTCIEEFDTEEEARNRSLDGVVYLVSKKVVKRTITTWESVDD